MQHSEIDRSGRDASRFAPPRHDLSHALHNLADVVNEAKEEGFPLPSASAHADARRLLPALHKIARCHFEVYPTPDGEVAIDASCSPGSSVILLCRSQGGALCLVNMNGQHRRKRYSDTDQLPDRFVENALLELEGQSHPEL